MYSRFLLILVLFVSANSIARQPGPPPYVGSWKLVNCKVNGKQIKSPELTLEISQYSPAIDWQENGVFIENHFLLSNSIINCKNRKSFYYKYFQKATYNAVGNMLHINSIGKSYKCELLFARIATINLDTVTPAIYFDFSFIENLNNLYFEGQVPAGSLYVSRNILTNKSTVNLTVNNVTYTGSVNCTFKYDSIPAILTMEGTFQDSLQTSYPFYLHQKYTGSASNKNDTFNFKFGNNRYRFYTSTLQILFDESRYLDVYNQKPWASKNYLLTKLQYRNNCYSAADYITVNFDTVLHTMSLNCTSINGNPIQLTYNFTYNANGDISFSKTNNFVLKENVPNAYQFKELENILLREKKFKMRLDNIILIADEDNMIEILNPNQFPYRQGLSEFYL